jgi:hypothetical protein
MIKKYTKKRKTILHNINNYIIIKIDKLDYNKTNDKKIFVFIIKLFFENETKYKIKT